VSLLSLSNISVLVLIDKFYGYYIHGRSVHNRADCNVLEIANQIKQEENGLAPKRGLSASSEQQVSAAAATVQLANASNCYPGV
jgi:meckelin